MVDTGEDTLKGGRLKRVEKYIDSDVFMCTYGDSVGDININELLDLHRRYGRLATVTGVIHPSRFGIIERNNNLVTRFSEKQKYDDKLINAGFFVFNKEMLELLMPNSDLEIGTLDIVAEHNQLAVYEHTGQWVCLDTPKDMGDLQNLWREGKAKWRVD
jgi:glucose-1-phosphate cytidylyltransferase